MPAQTPQPLAVARHLALWALLLPVLVLALIAAHSVWGARGAAFAEQRAILSLLARQQLTLTPAGRPPREGPYSHPAVDRRHAPGLPRAVGGAR